VDLGRICAGCNDGTIWAWSKALLTPTTNNNSKNKTKHSNSATSVYLSPKKESSRQCPVGKFLSCVASGVPVTELCLVRDVLVHAAFDGSVLIWDALAWQLRNRVICHSQSISHLFLHLPSNTLYSCAADNTVKIWDIDTLCLLPSSSSSSSSLSPSFAGFADNTGSSNDEDTSKSPPTRRSVMVSCMLFTLPCLGRFSSFLLVPIELFVLQGALSYVGDILSGSRTSRGPRNLNPSVQPLVTLPVTSEVYCIFVDHTRMFTGSHDGHIRIWDKQVPVSAIICMLFYVQVHVYY
jgi:WD40 repeat protein